MRFYTNVIFKAHENKLYYTGVENNERIVWSRDYAPYVFSETTEPTEFKAFYNNNISLKKEEFPTVSALKDFISRNKNTIHGIGVTTSDTDNRDFPYQFISDNFKGDVSYDQDEIKILNIDIETTSEKFPVIENPLEEIIAITCSVAYKGKLEYTTFGIEDYPNFEEDHKGKKYIHCGDEETLLKKFIAYFHKEQPNIVTGYNVNYFDIPYIISRIENVYNPDWANKLSPFGHKPIKMKVRSLHKTSEKVVKYDIPGVSVLDWLELYKKFTYITRDSYTLNNVSHIELDEKKLDYSEYKNLHTLYKNNWKLFISYNIKDVELVNKLEAKLKLIELAIRVAYVAKVNFGDVFSPVRLWDIMIYNYLLEKNIIIPIRRHIDKDRQNIGGRVKDPRIGFCEYLVSFDATSLYPSTMLSLNISPETFITKIDINEDDVLYKKVNPTELIKKDIILASNGALFDKSRKGILVDLIQNRFDERTSYKEMMFNLENEGGDPNLIKKYNVFQEAIKILMNSLYGCMCNEYFRYFNLDIAEAITVTGQTIVQTAEIALNDYINMILETKDVDYTVFSDTDSCAVELKGLMEKYNIPEERANEFLDKVAKEKFDPLLNKVFDDFSKLLNFYQNKIFFKREMIVRKGLIVAKKKYVMNVLSKEKVIYTPPKLTVKGLEIVRSSTPEIVRGYLKDTVKTVLNTNETETQDYIKGFKDRFYDSPIEDISFPRGVSDVEKYLFNGGFKEGCPIHVRAAITYNIMIISLGLQNKYELIKDGDKIKFVYLLLPNPTKQNVIGFKDFLPEELGFLTDYIDYYTQFQKSYLNPVSSIFEAIGWQVDKKNTFDEFF